MESDSTPPADGDRSLTITDDYLPPGPTLSAMALPRTDPLTPAYDPAPYRRNIRVYYLFMASTGFMIFLPIWIIYLMNGRGLSLTEVGVFEAVFWITIIVAEVPTGAVADRFGRRVSLALGACLFAVATVIFAMADDFSLLLGSYLVMGIAMTLYSGAGDAFLYDTLRVLGRTREYERLAGRSHGLFWAMMVVATAVGGPISYLIGYSATILISSSFFLVSAVFALLMHEPPRRESDFPPDPLHAPPADVQHSSTDSAHSGMPIFHEMIEGFRMVWRIRPVRYLVPFAAVMIALFDMPRFLVQPFVAQHGLDPLASVTDGFVWSALLVPAYLGSMIGMLAAGQLMARLGERRSFPRRLAVRRGVHDSSRDLEPPGNTRRHLPDQHRAGGRPAHRQRLHQPADRVRSTSHCALNLLPDRRRRDGRHPGHCRARRRRAVLPDCVRHRARHGRHHRRGDCGTSGSWPTAATKPNVSANGRCPSPSRRPSITAVPERVKRIT